MAVSEEKPRQDLEKATSATPNYSVDYSDERFANVKADKYAAIAENNAVYDSMIAESNKYFDDQIQASKDWADKQAQIQQDNTDFAIEQIEQQKDQAHKDYLKEQSGAYVDWQKQSNPYGTEAERMASSGMLGTGYSESSQVSMYNTYQNRVATARESYNQAVLNYNNAIKDAQLQNNAALAEIAYNALQQQLELSLQGFQYKNNLILEQANKKTELDNIYYNRYQDVLNQINTENALAEDIRQFNKNMAWQTEQAELDRQHDFALQQAEQAHEKTMAQIEQDYKLALIKAQTKADKELADYNYQIAKKAADDQLKRDKERIAYEYQQKSTYSGGSGGSGGGSGGTVKGNNNNSYQNIISRLAGIKPSGSSPSGATLNTKSVLSLGKGPINGKTVANMINSGNATATVKNGQVYVAPAKPILPTSRFKK